MNATIPSLKLPVSSSIYRGLPRYHRESRRAEVSTCTTVTAFIRTPLYPKNRGREADPIEIHVQVTVLASGRESREDIKRVRVCPPDYTECEDILSTRARPLHWADFQQLLRIRPSDPRSLIHAKPNPKLLLGPSSFSSQSQKFVDEAPYKELQALSRKPSIVRYAIIIRRAVANTGKRLPGIATNHDAFVRIRSTTYRVAVGAWLVCFRRWSIFRCFIYPGAEVTPFDKQHGFIIVSNWEVDHNSGPVPRAPRWRDITYSMREEWRQIVDGKKMDGTLL